MARALRVAIIGGGLGGLAAAKALGLRGFEIQVYEASPVLLEVGGGLTLGPNAMMALRSIELEDPVRRIAFSPEHNLTHHWKSGRVIRRLNRQDTVSRYGTASHTIHRVDLLHTFAQELGDGVISLGKTCDSVASDGSVASAHFADGAEVEADVVLGADGIRSAVRTSLFGPDAPRFTGKVVYRTEPIPIDAVPGGAPSLDSHLWLGPHGAVVIFPVRRGELINFHAHHDDETYTNESWVTECDREEVLRVHAGWHESLGRLFSASTVWYKWALFDRDPIAQWSKGRATLLGDAAHPMLPYLGQGVCQAIEDGCVLAAALTAEDDVPAALRLYEDARRPRTSKIVLEARAQGVYNHLSSPTAIFKRDLRMRWQERRRRNSAAGSDWISGYNAGAPDILAQATRTD